MPFIYPTATEVTRIEQELVTRDRAGRVGIDIMPVRGTNFAKVRWNQRDNYYGLQALRGMDGRPTRVARVGEHTYEYEPGVFGEYVDITETELTTRAGGVSDVSSTPIDVSDLVAEADQLLIGREWDRIESSNWAVLTTGTITIKIDGPNGTQTGYSDTWAIQTFTASVVWSTSATATPFRDFQAVGALGIGKGVAFNSSARAYMNSTTANNMLNNTNNSDLNGRRIGGGNTVNTLRDSIEYLVANDLPRIVVYDGGYIPTVGGSFTRFIPNGKVVVVGGRPSGATVGEYLFTRNASAGYRPVSYRYVVDRANGGGAAAAEKRTPANLEIHRGHNGGPAIYYPGAVVLMNV